MNAVRLQPGSVFAGDYRVLRPLGAGGMGAVYVVEQRSTGARRALKLMLPSFAEDPDARRRFDREARAAALIDSDHVVQVLASGVDEATGAPWLVMELLEGEDLAAYVRRIGPLPPTEIVEIFKQLGHALRAAHAAGIVHRDLKPENLFISTARRAGAPFTIKVLDFGIAKFVADSADGGTAAIGSIRWMAPEQTQHGATLSPATDVWALGLIAFWILTGKSYWVGGNTDQPSTHHLLREIVVDPLVKASDRDEALRATPYCAAFDAWFARSAARDPAARFKDGGEACAALVQAIEVHAGTASARLSMDVASRRSAQHGPDGPPKTRLLVGLAVALLASAAIGVATYSARLATSADTTASPPSSSSSAMPPPTTITDLPPPKCSNPKVMSLYRGVLQSMRDANFLSAHGAIAEAAKLEPDCAAVEIRAAMLGDDVVAKRASYRKATEYRAGLSEHDLTLLGILEPLYREEPDERLAGERAREAADRHFGDAELARMACRYVADSTIALTYCRRATTLDPLYADAWQMTSKQLSRLGRNVEELATLDKCIEISPTSVDCRRWRATTYTDIGECDRAASDLREAIAAAPDSLGLREDMADLLISIGRPRETILLSLEQKWKVVPEDKRAPRKALDLAELDDSFGEVESALAHLHEAEMALEANPDAELQGDLAGLQVRLLHAVGMQKEAGKVAETYLDRRSVLTGSDDWTPITFEYAKFRAGLSSRAEFEAAREKEASRWKAQRDSPWRIWWRTFVANWDDPEESKRALEAMPAGAPPSTWAAAAGEVYALNGKFTEALPLLKLGTKACSRRTSESEALAAALAGVGDEAAACQLYTTLEKRWGTATLRAKRVHARSVALHCDARSGATPKGQRAGDAK